MLPWVLAATLVALEIGYPLSGHGGLRTALTIATVVTFAAAALAHALVSRGRLAAGWLFVAAAGLGFALEYAGLRTGEPFGCYSYGASLGPTIAGVPVVVPLAWLMMAWPAYLVAGRLAGRRTWAIPLLTGWALASWDVFLDPQMVDAGRWTWCHPTPALPGVSGVPVQNYAGWFGAGVVLGVLLLPLSRRRSRGGDGQPIALFLWTYASSIVANLAFFGRPGVALAGGLLMGVIALPLAATVIARP